MTVSEPVHSRIFLTANTSSPHWIRIYPSSSPRIKASPCTIVTPLPFSLALTPSVSFFTVLFFRAMILPRSKPGVASACIPYLDALFMLSSILAEYNNVLVGIQPSFRQTPPMAFFSKRIVFNPFSAARSPAV